MLAENRLSALHLRFWLDETTTVSNCQYNQSMPLMLAENSPKVQLEAVPLTIVFPNAPRSQSSPESLYMRS